MTARRSWSKKRPLTLASAMVDTRVTASTRGEPSGRSGTAVRRTAASTWRTPGNCAMAWVADGRDSSRCRRRCWCRRRPTRPGSRGWCSPGRWRTTTGSAARPPVHPWRRRPPARPAGPGTGSRPAGGGRWPGTGTTRPRTRLTVAVRTPGTSQQCAPPGGADQGGHPAVHVVPRASDGRSPTGGCHPHSGTPALTLGAAG